jgi:ATP-dependent helicase HrpA
VQRLRRERAALVERSQAAVAMRVARLPCPAFDDALPIAEHRAEIARLISAHPVVIVCGETGSGKTTQLPRIALALKQGGRGLIGCTQPRRLAARTLARRLAQELPGVPPSFVGHKVRFNDATESDTVVKVMTDGVLLAEVHGDPLLSAYDTLIIDEAHERSLNIDFLLGIIKRLLPRRPDLKVIVTSATIDTDRFSRFFDGAPVIEVSGRTHPVEVRYRPDYLESEAEGDINVAIVAALRELSRERPGDVLVFLPGEREIREAADEIGRAKVGQYEILPLYARLSNALQDRVFRSDGGLRIVLATNVAETSLTVPGIRYVIDTGLARVNRYDARSKIERLQVEPISQAAARQRAGRCGRVAAGIAIRLYAEEDFLARPAYTTAEILRTSLAAVILRMLSADLGEPLDFPFIEPPAPRLIEDGYRELIELGALDGERNLTPEGRELARIPVEPHVGRMLLAGRAYDCVREMLILASALEMQDPRDRPQESRETADQRHEYFRDKESDFATLLNIWRWFDQAWQEKASNRAFIDDCQQRFLNHLRLREWRDLHRQLSEIAETIGLTINTQPATYERLHKALLTGLLGNVGQKATEGEHYQGTRGVQFLISPGSALRKGRPRWVMAAALQETTRIYARSAARIEPEWIESLAAHVVTRRYFEPHWERARGEVMAFEQVSLYGLVINPRRRIRYAPIDPRTTRDVFIRRALVEGDIDTRAAFFGFNQALIREVEALEHKARRQDVLVDDEVLYRFYDANIPGEILDQKSLENWYAEQSRGITDLLHLSRAQLMRHAAAAVTVDLYPDSLLVEGARLSLKYRFEPGHALDGVTLTLPLALLNAVPDALPDWLTPGMIREKVTWLLRALPKALRTRFMPVADYVTLFLESTKPGEQGLTQALADFVRTLAGAPVTAEVWKACVPPPHLMMNIRVVDDAGNELASSRDLSALRAQLGEAAQLTFAKGGDDRTGIERSGITRWDFGDLPERLTFKRNGQPYTGYPALLDEQDSVAIRLVDTSRAAEAGTRAGVVRLLRLELAEQVRQVARSLEAGPGMNALAMQLSPVMRPEELRAELTDLIARRAFLGDDPVPRSERAYVDQRARARARLPAVREAAVKHAQEIAATWHELQSALSKGAAIFPRQVAELRAQRDALVYRGALLATPWAQLQHLPRYLRGLRYRLGKLREWGERDARHGAAVAALWQRYADRLAANRKAGIEEPALDEFRWLIEELRVSLFAQELKTPIPVSLKRLERFWGEKVGR